MVGALNLLGCREAPRFNTKRPAGRWFSGKSIPKQKQKGYGEVSNFAPLWCQGNLNSSSLNW